MKNLIYSLIAVLFLLFGCAQMDEFSSLDKKDAYSVEIATSAVGDSTFTLNITPQAGTMYYSYIVKEESNPKLPSATLLLSGKESGGIDGKVLNFNENQSHSIVLKKLKQNTTYQIYAVAGNDQGITGEISNTSVVTTDSYIPNIKDFEEDGNTITLLFDEPIKRGAGVVTIDYYFMNTPSAKISVQNPTDSIVVSGKEVLITLRDYPGAYACVSYAAGAFADMQDNACKALSSGINSAGKFVGVYYRMDKTTFDIEEVAPEAGAFKNWEDFVIEFSFEMPIFKPKTASSDDIQVIYYSDGHKTIIDVPTSYWGVSSGDPTKLLVYLPEEPTFGGYVDVVMKEGTVEDKAGNLSAAYEPEEEKTWLYSYGYTLDKVLHKYHYVAEQTKSGDPVEFDIEILKNTDPKAGDNDILVKGIYGFDTPLEGYFNGDNATVNIESVQLLGELGDYLAVLWDYNEGDYIVWKVNEDGSMENTSYMELAGHNRETGKYAGTFEISMGGTFTIMEEANPVRIPYRISSLTSSSKKTSKIVIQK